MNGIFMSRPRCHWSAGKTVFTSYDTPLHIFQPTVSNSYLEMEGGRLIKGFYYWTRGGTPLYGLYRYVRPQRVWFFSRFGHKLGIDFSHFAAILVIYKVSIFAL